MIQVSAIIIGVPQAMSAMQRLIDGADSGSVYVGSDSPYAARIELGFHGYDSLGRFYNQAPQPWLLPAFLGVAPVVPAMVMAALMTGGGAMSGLRQGANQISEIAGDLVPKDTWALYASIEVGDV